MSHALRSDYVAPATALTDKDAPTRVAYAHDAPVVSPARDLQALVARSMAEPEPSRWPGAVRLIVILGGSAALWVGLFSAAAFVVGRS